MANKIHKVDDTFVISDDGGWLPGCYDSFETAEKAHAVKHLENWNFLQRLQNEANTRNAGVDGVITLNDIKNKSARS